MKINDTKALAETWLKAYEKHSLKKAYPNPDNLLPLIKDKSKRRNKAK